VDAGRIELRLADVARDALRGADELHQVVRRCRASYSGNADNLLAQQATLANPATLRSLSFYVAAADGNLRLGLYDDTGPDNGPGDKKAETAEFVPKMGWNTVDVVTPVLLPAGDYWLAYAPSSNDLHFELAGDGTGSIAFFPNPYGPMPQTFSTTPQTNNDHWSFYATLNP
jgi:hypothetical protein